MIVLKFNNQQSFNFNKKISSSIFFGLDSFTKMSSIPSHSQSLGRLIIYCFTIPFFLLRIAIYVFKSIFFSSFVLNKIVCKVFLTDSFFVYSHDKLSIWNNFPLNSNLRLNFLSEWLVIFSFLFGVEILS